MVEYKETLDKMMALMKEHHKEIITEQTVITMNLVKKEFSTLKFTVKYHDEISK